MGNTVTAVYSRNRISITRALHQYDYGQKLLFEEFELGESFEVHFANSKESEVIVKTGAENAVDIPDCCLKSGNDIIAWLYAHTGDEDGETAYTIYIPVIRRASIPAEGGGC